MWTTYDLRQYAVILAKNKDTRHLARKIDRMSSLRSIIFDLKTTKTMIDLLVSSMDSRGRGDVPLQPSAAVIDNALFTAALVIYSRCTDTRSDSRGHLDVAKALDDKDRLVHVELINLRNAAIAHHGAGKHHSGSWADDTLRLAINNETSDTMITSTAERANYRGRAVLELASLIPRSIAIAQSQVVELNEIIINDLNRMPIAIQKKLLNCDPKQKNTLTSGTSRESGWTPRGMVVMDPEGNVEDVSSEK